MARRSLSQAIPPPEPPIAPMIDCVFQLLIFLVVVTDLSAKTAEPLQLPDADQAVVEENADPEEVVVNIFGEAEARRRGGEADPAYFSVQGRLHRPADLKRMFENLKAIRGHEVPGGKVVRYTLYLRGDRATPWLRVQEAMTIAVRFGGVHKLALAGRMVDPRDPPRDAP